MEEEDGLVVMADLANTGLGFDEATVLGRGTKAKTSATDRKDRKAREKAIFMVPVEVKASREHQSFHLETPNDTIDVIIPTIAEDPRGNSVL